ncbi:filamentous hemagglutinin N-terminal domain-containing protein, partial [Candidatus Omnitrophota bacterium]
MYKISIFTFALFFAGMGSLYSLPVPDKVVEGQAEFNYPDASTLSINASDKAIISYSSFNIAGNESVIINLPSVNSEILNRALGGSYSQLLGDLSCNGTFILINTSGIYAGPAANINAASLVLSTRDISNQDFLNGNYLFKKLSEDELDTLLLNEGNINVRDGGFVALIAGAIENRGSIVARMGTIALAGGDAVKLELAGNSLISVAIEEPVASQIVDFEGTPITEQIKNTGTLDAQGGAVILKAESLPGIFAKAINLEGTVKGTRLAKSNGTIRIVADGDIEVAGDIQATNIALGDKESNIIPDNVTIAEQAYVKAEELIDIIADNYINIKSVIQAPNILLQANAGIETTDSAIIQAQNLKLLSNRFGSYTRVLNIDAENIHIERLYNYLTIAESTGIGTSIRLRGPPEGWGAILYNRDANLTLEAQKVSVAGSSPTQFYGNITFYNFECTVPAKELIFQAGKTYTFKGNLNIIGSPDIGQEEYYIKLRSQDPGQYWYLDLRADSSVIDRINISDCYAGNYIFIPRGINSGNNVNLEIDPTWDGGGTTYEWSEALNWEGNQLPDGDAVTFDGTSTKDSVVDAAFSNSILSLTITADYTGTISLATGLTITGSGTCFSQAGGTFNETVDTAGGNACNITHPNGALSVTAGTFNGPSNPNGATTPATRIASESDLQTVCANLTLDYVQTADITLI